MEDKMNKKILTPLRSYSNERVYYIYKEYLHMFKKHNFDVIAIGNISDETLDFFPQTEFCNCVHLQISVENSGHLTFMLLKHS